MRGSRLIVLAAVVATAWAVSISYGDGVGTAFTYQGQLKSGGEPLTGSAEFQFTLWDAEVDGTQIGAMVATIDSNIGDGLVSFELDFGADMFGPDARWLQIAIRSPIDPGDTEPFTTLSPRQTITAAPVALYALNGPGSGESGFWAASGDDIFSTNSGNVGIGVTPSVSLHIRQLTGLPTGPATTLGLEWTSVPGEESWCSLSVNANELTEGTDFFRETNTPLRFSTKDELDSSSTATQMVLAGSGYLGIGTSYPEAYLDVRPGLGTTADEILVASSPADAVYASSDVAVIQGGPASGYTGTVLKVESRSGDSSAYALLDIRNDVANSPSSKLYVRGDGHVGIGTTDPQARLDILADDASSGLFVDSTGGSVAGYFNVSNSCGSSALWAFSNSNCSSTAIISNSGTGKALEVWGTASVNVLEITGADLAEKFPVSEPVQPGMVLAIDPEHPGQLCLARGAYNRRVAGIVSGANGLAAGAVLGHLPGHEDSPPVALSGRVWVHCDASARPIEVGDLLTSSDTPGYAMKVVDHDRAHGAVIGKAMTALDGGRGLVLVLVSLQ